MRRPAVLVYPNQLFADHPALARAPDAPVLVVHDPLVTDRYSFHPLRRSYQRLSVDLFVARARQAGRAVREVSAAELRSAAGERPGAVPDSSADPPASCGTVARLAAEELNADGLVVCDPVDDWIERGLRAGARDAAVRLELLDSPAFLLTREEVASECAAGTLAMADFYRRRRRAHGVLLTESGGPVGGTWSFDPDNRRRIPKRMEPPPQAVIAGPEDERAAREVLETPPPYPASPESATAWLDEFVHRRLGRFGDYEDAVDGRDWRWYHSVLSPMLNTGLVTPRTVLDRTLAVASDAEDAGRPIPLNSLEGFIRQVIGWREFMRVSYVARGRGMRTRNFFGHTRRLPEALRDGHSGLTPFDSAVAKARKWAWTHHIERLMVIGNLMLLCEIDPDEVYRFFMERFIDAWDWVMVPNVYAMSQYADGGGITTKPYLSGSNYLHKMTDSPRGDWEDVWDGLYWRFIDRRQDFFAGNRRMAVMVRALGRLSTERRQRIFAAAERFLDTLG